MSSKHNCGLLLLSVVLEVTACGDNEEVLSSNDQSISNLTLSMRSPETGVQIQQTNSKSAEDGSQSYDWPFNGSIQNNYSSRVVAWVSDIGPCTGEKTGLRWVDPGTTSHWTYDVDHVKSPGGQWYKIGWNNAIVDSAGHVTNVKCAVSACGMDCGK